MIAPAICLQLALHLTACESALSALDAQYRVFEPVRKFEEYARIGIEGYVGKRGVEGIAIFVGPALDWQLRGRIYLSIEGKF